MSKKKNNNVFFKYFIFFLILLAICFSGFVLGTVASIMTAADTLDYNELSLDLTSIIYAKDSKTGEYVEMARIYDDENRVWVDSEKIPQNLKDAIVAIEDERFYKHHGFDLKRLTGAAINVLFTGDSSYGGSTITQQLVKNITGDKDQTITRKIQGCKFGKASFKGTES